MEAFILWALVSFMLRRAEPRGLDATFSSINYICASKISSDKDIKDKDIWKLQYKNYHLSQKISHIDYFIWTKKFL